MINKEDDRSGFEQMLPAWHISSELLRFTATFSWQNAAMFCIFKVIVLRALPLVECQENTDLMAHQSNLLPILPSSVVV